MENSLIRRVRYCWTPNFILLNPSKSIFIPTVFKTSKNRSTEIGRFLMKTAETSARCEENRTQSWWLIWIFFFSKMVPIFAGALRLRTAQHSVGAADAGRVETGQPQGLGDGDRHARPARHEPLQAGRRGRAALPVAHRRPLPRHGPREGDDCPTTKRTSSTMFFFQS